MNEVFFVYKALRQELLIEYFCDEKTLDFFLSLISNSSVILH